MAKIDHVNGAEFINVSATVGRNGVNLKEDVMVVQALLKYALDEISDYLGVKCPMPNGTMDSGTARLIQKFQKLGDNSRKIVADGRIDPAKGSFVNGKKRRWTILELNSKALETWLLYSGKNGGYIEDICAKYPQVKVALANSVGTLGLSLESSSGVGSLGLEIE